MNNSVFISYRRNISAYMARAVFQDLRANGIDAFMDIESIDSGQFDTTILNQIAARPYFLVILTPGTLDRCTEPGDWLLREMEHALKFKRIVIPLISPNFDFTDFKKFLPEPLASELPRFNNISVPHDFFEAAMDRLRTRFLKSVDLSGTPTPKVDGLIIGHRQQIPDVDLSGTPMPKADGPVVRQQDVQVIAEAPATRPHVSGLDYFFHANHRPNNDLDGQIADYTEAIQLDPQFTDAYYYRGITRYRKGDLDAAIADYNEAIRLNPQYANAYYDRALVRAEKKYFSSAIADGQRFLELQPDDSGAPKMRKNIAEWSKLL